MCIRDSKYPTFSEINHTSVITKVHRSTGQLWLNQSDTNYDLTPLSDQQARIKAQFNGYATLYIQHVTM